MSEGPMSVEDHYDFLDWLIAGNLEGTNEDDEEVEDDDDQA